MTYRQSVLHWNAEADQQDLPSNLLMDYLRGEPYVFDDLKAGMTTCVTEAVVKHRQLI